MKLTPDSDLVGHIAGFTSLRDSELLEVSLLKSVYAALRPNVVSMISIDSDNIVINRLEYSAKGHCAGVEDQVAEEPLLTACECLDRGTKEYCSILNDDICITLFLLSQSRRVSQYIYIESEGNSIMQSDSYQIVGMLKVFQNFRALLTESQTDELTGLPNRKAFGNVASKIRNTKPQPAELIEGDKRATCSTSSFYWLALADLDNFKAINDNFGHLMGDEVLVRVAQTIQTHVRESDLVFRYGGEEFALILYAESQQQVAAVLERVRVAVAQLDFQKMGNITVSMGYTQMRDDIFTLSLIEIADSALYESKDSGKNCITFKEPETVYQGSIEDSDIELF